MRRGGSRTRSPRTAAEALALTEVGPAGSRGRTVRSTSKSSSQTSEGIVVSWSFGGMRALCALSSSITAVAVVGVVFVVVVVGLAVMMGRGDVVGVSDTDDDDDGVVVVVADDAALVPW